MESSYYHRPQHRDESTESTTLLDESFSDSLLLSFFKQQVLIIDILQSTIQLGLNVTPSCMQETIKNTFCHNWWSTWKNNLFSVGTAAGLCFRNSSLNQHFPLNQSSKASSSVKYFIASSSLVHRLEIHLNSRGFNKPKISFHVRTSSKC